MKLTFEAPCIRRGVMVFSFIIAFGGLKFVDDLNMEIEMSSLDIPCFALFKLEAATFSVFPPAVENPDFIVFVFSFIVFEVKPLFVFSFSNFGVSTMFDVDVLDTLKFSVVLFT